MTENNNRFNTDKFETVELEPGATSVNEPVGNGAGYEPNFVLQDTPDDGLGGLGGQTTSNADNFANSTPGQGPADPQSNQHNYDWKMDPRENFNGRSKEPKESQNPNVNNKSKKPKAPAKAVTLTRKSLAMLVIVVMLISVILGGGSGLLVNSVLSNNGTTSSSTISSDKSSNSNNVGDYKLEDATNSKLTIAQITEKTQDSVVEIKTEGISTDTWMQQYVTEGAGSGVIISSDGYIITNNHVVSDANKITVTTTDDKQYEAKLVGTDAMNDIAVLKISAKGLTAATYGNSDKLEVGEMAVAIGNPLGELGGTVTSGIISATDREVNIDGATLNLLQTDASINPGNSGGGLFNDSGQLIGIVVAKSSGSDIDNIGFAIPINVAAEVANQLIDKGYVSGQPSTGMSYSESSSRGVYIAEVSGKNAKSAGFKEGDIVYSVDGEVIDSFKTLSSIITSKKPGDKVKYIVVRDQRTIEITLELGEKTS